jgi:hypothetical protein
MQFRAEKKSVEPDDLENLNVTREKTQVKKLMLANGIIPHSRCIDIKSNMICRQAEKVMYGSCD